MAKESTHSSNRPTEVQLLKQLASAPIVDVLGILASGVSGHRSRGETKWTLLFTFASWRIAGDRLHTHDLVVRRKVGERAIDRYRRLIKQNTATRIRARVVEESVFGGPQALLVRVMGQDRSDADMNAEVKRLQKPVRIKDRMFGTLTLDRRFKSFEGVAVWNGRKVQLTLWAHEASQLDKALKAARTLLRSQKSWQAKVLAYAVEQLLAVKNESWLGAGEKPVTAAQFQRQMTSPSIEVSPDGSFDFWFDGGDLFFDHSIQIRGSLAKGLTSAVIQG